MRKETPTTDEIKQGFILVRAELQDFIADKIQQARTNSVGVKIRKLQRRLWLSG